MGKSIEGLIISHSIIMKQKTGYSLIAGFLNVPTKTALNDLKCTYKIA